jgi:predicted O-methyltransferase YrrM
MSKEIILNSIGHMLDLQSASQMFDILVSMPDHGRLLETGTGWGDSSAFFSRVKPQWTIYTVDAFGLYGDGRIYPAYEPTAVKKIIDNHPANVIQILGDSKKISWELSLDFLYIDADHTLKGCRADYNLYGKYLKSGGILVFDDYSQPNNPANGVKTVVNQVLQNGYELLFTGVSAILRKL